MEFNEYQNRSRKTALYPNAGDNVLYPTLGLCGESGEVADKIKKIIRDHDGIITREKRDDIAQELGDVLWYIAQLATELDLDFNDIAEMNIKKLYSRMDRGKLHGSGDTR